MVIVNELCLSVDTLVAYIQVVRYGACWLVRYFGRVVQLKSTTVLTSIGTIRCTLELIVGNTQHGQFMPKRYPFS